MKLFSIILISIILAFSSQPLMSHLVHERQMNNIVAEHNCCGNCSGECCGDQGEDSPDDTRHDCSKDCICIIDGVVVFTHGISREINLFETLIEKIAHYYSPYQFSLAPTIWHPPQHQKA